MTGSEADFRTTPYRVQYSQGSTLLQDENAPLPWFTVGAMLRQRLAGPLAVQAELNYVRGGGQFNNAAGGSGFVLDNGSYAIDCIQVPALLNLKVITLSNVSLHLEGGAAANIITNGVKLDQAHLHPSNHFANPSALLTTVLGAELDWHHSERWYLLGLRFTQDHADFYQREYNGTQYNLRSSGLFITAGMLLARKG